MSDVNREPSTPEGKKDAGAKPNSRKVEPRTPDNDRLTEFERQAERHRLEFQKAKDRHKIEYQKAKDLLKDKHNIGMPNHRNALNRVMAENQRRERELAEMRQQNTVINRVKERSAEMKLVMKEHELRVRNEQFRLRHFRQQQERMREVQDRIIHREVDQGLAVHAGAPRQRKRQKDMDVDEIVVDLGDVIEIAPVNPDVVVPKKQKRKSRKSCSADGAKKLEESKNEKPKTKVQLTRTYDGLDYKPDDPEIQVHPVCEFSIYCDVFLYCRDENDKLCIIPMHKKFLRDNVPYFEAMYRDESNWRENGKPGAKSPTTVNHGVEETAPSEIQQIDAEFDINQPSTSKRWDKQRPLMKPSDGKQSPGDTKETSLAKSADKDDSVLVAEESGDLPDNFCQELTKQFRAKELSTYFKILYNNDKADEIVGNIVMQEEIQLYRLTSYLNDFQLSEFLRQDISHNITIDCMADLWRLKEYNFRPQIITALGTILVDSDIDSADADLSLFITSIVNDTDLLGNEVADFINQMIEVVSDSKRLCDAMSTFVNSRSLEETKEMIANVDFIKLNGESPSESDNASKRSLFNEIVHRFIKDGTEVGVIEIYKHIFKELISADDIAKI